MYVYNISDRKLYTYIYIYVDSPAVELKKYTLFQYTVLIGANTT